MPTLTPSFRRLTALLGATALVSGLGGLSAARAQQAEPPVTPPNSTLDLTLNTGAATGTKTEAQPAGAPAKKSPTPTPAPKQAAPKKPARSTSTRLTTLPSRRTSAPRGQATATGTPPPQVATGRLGRVVPESATLRGGREADARPLSIVPRGTNLAVVQETDTHYGVLMIDQTVGWIPKASVELVDYQVEIQFPAQPEAPAQPSQTDPRQLAGDVDARMEPLLREAFSYLGVPYVWAGNTRRGLDCSGFVKNVFATFGVNLPRHSGDQIVKGQPVNSTDELRAGDRLYFDMKRSGRISHCGIYIGNGYFIHASTNQKQVGVDRLDKANYRNALVAARRDFE